MFVPLRQFHHPHPMVVRIRNVHVPLRIDATTMRSIHPRCRRWAAVAARAFAAAGDGGHHVSPGVDLADAVILAIDDVDVAGGVTADSLRSGEDGLPGVAAVAGIAPFAGPGDRGDRAV